MSITINYREFNQDKVNQAWDELSDHGFNSPISQSTVADIKDEFVQTDKERILSAIIKKDMEFISRSSGTAFSEPLNMQNEDIVVWLFGAALDVNLEDEEFFPDNAVAGIPLELWVRLFQNLPPHIMDTVKVKCKKAGYSFDQFRAYLLGVKNVVKFCLDHHSEMIAYYEGGPSGVMRTRAEHIYKHLVPEQKVAV